MKLERKTSCTRHTLRGISSQLAISGLLFLLFFAGRFSFLCRVEVRTDRGRPLHTLTQGNGTPVCVRPSQTSLNQKCLLHLLLHFHNGVIHERLSGPGPRQRLPGIWRLRCTCASQESGTLISHPFWVICLFCHWYHGPSLPTSLSGITGSSVHLRPRQPQKLSLSPPPRNPSLALFDRGKTRSNNYALCLVSLATPVRQTK